MVDIATLNRKTPVQRPAHPDTQGEDVEILVEIENETRESRGQGCSAGIALSKAAILL